MFFFEKKNQKTFTRLAPRKLETHTPGGEGARAKVFCFFFSKKKLFLTSLLCLSVCACGKKGFPSPPGPGDQVIYPRTYPTH
jgi:hypothetical protein